MRKYIGEMIWFSGLFFVIFVLVSLGGCCNASTVSVPGSQREVCSPLQKGRVSDKGSEYENDSDARRLEALKCLAPSRLKAGK